MPFDLSEADKTILLKIAREAIISRLDNRRPEWPSHSGTLDEQRAAFVTLHKKGRLRGCIGRMVADITLEKVVREMAMAAAFEDPRFSPLAKAEIQDIDLEISVLSPMEQCKSEDIVPEIGRASCRERV